jgi:hypothetical protein
MRCIRECSCSGHHPAPPNAHHHLSKATTTEGKPLGTGRVNDVVRPQRTVLFEPVLTNWPTDMLRLPAPFFQIPPKRFEVDSKAPQSWF